MDKKELLADIADIEEGLNNPGIPETQKENMRSALVVAKGKLAKLEATEKPKPAKPAPAKTTKTANRQEVFTALQKQFPDLTRASVDKITETAHADLKQKMTAAAIAAGAGENAAAWATYFLSKKLPEGKKPAETPASEKPKKAVEKRTPFDWMQKIHGTEGLNEIAIGFRYFIAKKDAVITTRGVAVPVKKGDAVLVNPEGYPVTFLTGNTLERVLAASKTLNQGEKITLLEKQLARRTRQAKTFLQGRHQPTPQAAPAPAQRPEPKKDDKPAAAPAKPAATKRHTCTAEELDVAEMSGKLAKFVKDNTWKGLLKGREIEGLYYTTGEKGILLAKITDWGFPSKTHWFKVCPQSFNLTKTDEPKRGTIRRIVTDAELKEIYATKGPQVHRQCLTVYRKFYECSKEGNCDAEIRQKLSNSYSTCGDLVKRFDVLPDYMTGFHLEVKKRRKDKESYAEATSRVAKELRAEMRN